MEKGAPSVGTPSLARSIRSNQQDSSVKAEVVDDDTETLNDEIGPIDGINENTEKGEGRTSENAEPAKTQDDDAGLSPKEATGDSCESKATSVTINSSPSTSTTTTQASDMPLVSQNIFGPPLPPHFVKSSADTVPTMPPSVDPLPYPTYPTSNLSSSPYSSLPVPSDTLYPSATIPNMPTTPFQPQTAPAPPPRPTLPHPSSTSTFTDPFAASSPFTSLPSLSAIQSSAAGAIRTFSGHGASLGFMSEDDTTTLATLNAQYLTAMLATRTRNRQGQSQSTSQDINAHTSNNTTDSIPPPSSLPPPPPPPPPPRMGDCESQPASSFASHRSAL